MSGSPSDRRSLPIPPANLRGIASCFVGALCLLLPADGLAHPSLYHQIELDLRDSSTIYLYLSVHVPDLPSALAAGVDPVSPGGDWLRERSDDDLRVLLDEGESLVKELFSFGVSQGSAEVSVDPLPLEFECETPDQIRDPTHDNGLPEGCLLVSAMLPNPGTPQELVLRYAPQGDKRLMLIISRPAAFPEVRDLAPGASVRIRLPGIPPQEREEKLPGWTPLLLLALFLGLVLWLAKQQRSAKE